jgi:hypothetical protein
MYVHLSIQYHYLTTQRWHYHVPQISIVPALLVFPLYCISPRTAGFSTVTSPSTQYNFKVYAPEGDDDCTMSVPPAKCCSLRGMQSDRVVECYTTLHLAERRSVENGIYSESYLNYAYLSLTQYQCIRRFIFKAHRTTMIHCLLRIDITQLEKTCWSIMREMECILLTFESCNLFCVL